MSDLISRSALLQEISNKMPTGSARGVFKAFVEDAPTAYDVDKVVAELEERAEGNLKCVNRLQGIERKTRLCEWEGRAGGLKTAIYIVKRGGRDE